MSFKFSLFICHEHKDFVYVDVYSEKNQPMKSFLFSVTFLDQNYRVLL